MTWTGEMDNKRERGRERETKKEHYIILNEYRNMKCNTQPHYTYPWSATWKRDTENNKIDTHSKAHTYALVQ